MYKIVNWESEYICILMIFMNAARTENVFNKMTCHRKDRGCQTPACVHTCVHMDTYLNKVMVLCWNC